MQSIQPTREEAINALQTLQKQREEERSSSVDLRKDSRFSRFKGSISSEIKEIEQKVLNFGESTFKYFSVASFIFSFVFLIVFILAWLYVSENKNKNTVLKNGVFSDATLLYTIQIIGIVMSLATAIFSGLGVFKYEMHKLQDQLNSPALKIFLIILFLGVGILFFCNALFFFSARNYDNSTTDTTKVDTASSSTVIDSTTTKTITTITIETTTKITREADEGFSFNTATILHLVLSCFAIVLCLVFAVAYLLSALHVNNRS